jgi:hypothetical protein
MRRVALGGGSPALLRTVRSHGSRALSTTTNLKERLMEIM